MTFCCCKICRRVVLTVLFLSSFYKALSEENLENNEIFVYRALVFKADIEKINYFVCNRKFIITKSVKQNLIKYIKAFEI